MPNDFDKIVKSYVKKYGKTIIATPQDAIYFFKKKIKDNKYKQLDFDKYYKTNKEDTEFFNLVHRLFYDNFYKQEAIKSMKTVMLGPVVAEIQKESIPVLMFLEKNKIQVRDCHIYAMYDVSKKIFFWTYPENVKMDCQLGFKKLSICNYNVISNLSIEEANQIALWYRVMYYYNKNILKDEWLDKNKKANTTRNLIVFSNVDEDGNEVYLYTLSDYGIKDNNSQEMMNKINIIMSFFQVKNNNTKKLKGHVISNDNSLQKLKIKKN